MKKKTIAIDIDGTLRNIDTAIELYLEVDHPHRVRPFVSNTDAWNRLDIAFDNDRDAVMHWLYEERAFHIFGQSPKMYPAVIDQLNALQKLADLSGKYEVWLSSVQRDQSITSTLFWLSKNGCRIRNIRFFDSFDQKTDHQFDVVVDDHPGVLSCARANGSVSIVVPHSYNEQLTEDGGYHRLDYSGDKPIGLAGIVDAIKLDTYKVIGEEDGANKA